jgi:hypothetical protein
MMDNLQHNSAEKWTTERVLSIRHWALARRSGVVAGTPLPDLWHNRSQSMNCLARISAVAPEPGIYWPPKTIGKSWGDGLRNGVK